MAHDSQLPCDGDGICMLCKKKPSEEDTLTCKTCVTPWHVTCLSSRPETLASTLQWQCPDCSPVTSENPAPLSGKSVVFVGSETSGELIAAIRAIEADEALTEQEKARKRQKLMSRGGRSSDLDEAEPSKKEKVNASNDMLDLLDGNLNCSFCMQLPERPVTTPCGHNFCLKCFQKWIGQGKRTCAKCRNTIPPKMASQPRINSSLVVAIRTARMSKSMGTGGPLKVYHFVHNQNRPDKAFTTERAKRAGKANACSGKIFVTVAPDHFGPILPENDPIRNQGVLVGECWEDRMECRQWGAHLPHVAGISGQSDYGAQSVALSGGYEDDEDHGEWFLYTGSGGRDLSGNKRTNKEQSFDQKFDKSNEALRVSCKKGYPVRVVRGCHCWSKDEIFRIPIPFELLCVTQGEAFFLCPRNRVRYDGIYRIEKCWRKVGIQGFKVCRYLFVRCDNDPAPWTSDEHGDRPRPFPEIKELKKATDTTERKESPSWDFDEEEDCWKWKKPPPLSRKPVDTGNPEDRKKARRAFRQSQNMSVREKLLKEFSCLICRKVMTLPLTTPCAHNFCKPCLEGAFVGQTFVRQRTCAGRRTLRAQKNIMKCPSCPTDISDFLQNPQVNRELMDVIESLQRKTEENEDGFSEDGFSDEETEVAEQNIDDVARCTEGGNVNSELQDDKDMNPVKACEMNKAEGADRSPKCDDAGNEMKKPREEPDLLNEEATQTDTMKVEIPKGCNMNIKAATTENKPKRSSKRKKPDNGDSLTGVGVEVRTRSKRAKDVDERNGSPSSPLHVQSDNDDFE